MDRAYQMFACHPLIEDGMRIPYRAEQVWLEYPSCAGVAR